jgi:hypothetical protein
LLINYNSALAWRALQIAANQKIKTYSFSKETKLSKRGSTHHQQLLAGQYSLPKTYQLAESFANTA